MKHISEIMTVVCKEHGITMNQGKEMIIDTPNEIELFRLCTLRSALKLEILGMSRRGRSVYSIVKEELGLKGSKKRVLEQLEEVITKRKEEI